MDYKEYVQTKWEQEQHRQGQNEQLSKQYVLAVDNCNSNGNLTSITSLIHLVNYNNDDTLFGLYELSKVSFKIFRFNITLTGESKFKGNRIISIGVLTEKNVLNNTNIISFVHNIVAPKDVLNLKLDVKILNNKKDSDKLDKYKLDIPCEMYSYGAIKAFAFNYCRFTFQTWCDIRDIKDKFSIETYTD